MAWEPKIETKHVEIVKLAREITGISDEWSTAGSELLDIRAAPPSCFCPPFSDKLTLGVVAHALGIDAGRVEFERSGIGRMIQNHLAEAVAERVSLLQIELHARIAAFRAAVSAAGSAQEAAGGPEPPQTTAGEDSGLYEPPSAPQEADPA